MSELDPEDAKIVTLARATRARTGAAQGAAVRDLDGRTYTAADVSLPSLRLAALEVAVAMAVSSGASGLEAAVVVTGSAAADAGMAAVRELGGVGTVVIVADPTGKVLARRRLPPP